MQSGSDEGENETENRMAVLRLTCVCALMIGGCRSGTDRPGEMSGQEADRAISNPALVVANGRAEMRSNIVALLGTDEITWDELRDTTMQAGAATALREAVLDRVLDRELKSQGLEITSAEINAERELLLETMALASGVPKEEIPRLLERLRRMRRMSERRFEAQLKRTAQLRRLVAGSIEVSEDDVAKRHEQLHGVKVRARLILVSDQTKAIQLHRTLEESSDLDRAGKFGQIAYFQSIDPSASIGGELGAVSPQDPTYPATVRAALLPATAGRLTPVLGVDRGYAILLIEGEVPEDGKTLEESRDVVQREVRLARERVAMDEMAGRLLHGTRLTILWPDVASAWALAEGDASR